MTTKLRMLPRNLLHFGGRLVHPAHTDAALTLQHIGRCRVQPRGRCQAQSRAAGRKRRVLPGDATFMTNATCIAPAETYQQAYCRVSFCVCPGPRAGSASFRLLWNCLVRCTLHVRMHRLPRRSWLWHCPRWCDCVQHVSPHLPSA